VTVDTTPTGASGAARSPAPEGRPSVRRAAGVVHSNLPVAELYERAIRADEGILAASGPLVVRTGRHTGRSPKDKFIVRDATTEKTIWWGEVNQPISPDHYATFRRRLLDHVASREMYAQDLFVGAAPAHRRSVRVFTETAWASIFARNLFRRPTADELATFAPNFTIIDAPSFHSDPAADGTRSETAILLDLAHMELLIAGTMYAGEIKKAAFTVMNYLLPDEGVLPMHSAVNVGQDGDPAVFFGLSGTGKTTLSADPYRTLIGDDEHGWGPDGLFNFEGGCYAKTIRLSPMYEPDIFQTTKRFGTILENVDVDPATRHLDLDSERFTENTRGAYPLDFIGNASDVGMTGHPRNVVLLTADAFGVLPPISRLTREQAMYHFLSGYTAKLAGTEVGVREPKATFSTCFGAPFMPRHPAEYARMLGERLDEHATKAWFVNTGWTGGPFGVGERMNINHTRAMVRAALSGGLDSVPTRRDPFFGLEVPISCPDVPAEFLDPRSTWADADAYDSQAGRLAAMFAENFRQYEGAVPAAVRDAGPVGGDGVEVTIDTGAGEG
jgi:phosphoenolpyruvate carboxykinase (ATP)